MRKLLTMLAASLILTSCGVTGSERPPQYDNAKNESISTQRIVAGHQDILERTLTSARNTHGSRYQTGKASWYQIKCNGGRRTASGRPLNDREYTAAHKRLPFGTKVLVRCKSTGRMVVVTITDRGPYIKGRVIDLSRAAAREIGLLGKGITNIELCQL